MSTSVVSENERDDNDKDPDYQPEYTTIELRDLHPDGSCDECEIIGTAEGDSMPNTSTAARNGQQNYIEKRAAKDFSYSRPSSKRDRRTSLIWTKFTIISKKDQIAACNICDQRMSIKSTSGNLKKHLERKHGFSIKLGVRNKRLPPRLITPTPRPKLPELSGVSDEGITLKVVGENGEEEHFEVVGQQYLSEGVIHESIQEHGYSTIKQQTNEQEREAEPLRIRSVRSLQDVTQSSYSGREPPPLYKAPPQRAFAHMDDAAKRRRISELQIECLENKKYNMQLEALAMEQQLNLPRSIFTQPLRYADVQTRGTQTEVGGNETRVFYVTNKRGGRPVRQIFAFDEDEDEY